MYSKVILKAKQQLVCFVGRNHFHLQIKKLFSSLQALFVLVISYCTVKLQSLHAHSNNQQIRVKQNKRKTFLNQKKKEEEEIIYHI